MATTSAVAPMPSAPTKPRRRWLRGMLLLIAFGVAAVVAFWWYTTVTTRRAWAEAEAEAALDLPRWKLLEMEQDRPDVPDAENSGLRIMSIRAKAGAFSVGAAPNYEKIFENLPTAAQLNTHQEKVIRERLKVISKELELARQLKDMPRGRLPITYTDDGISTLLPNHQDVRTMADWLQHDAWLLAQDKEFDKAVESCQAILVASRVFETDLFLISLLIRVSMHKISVEALERVLAQGEASEKSLRTIQAAIEREYNTSGWLQAVRGERAMIHHLFESIRDGKVTSGWSSVLEGARGKTFVEECQVKLSEQFPSTTLKYYPELLRHNKRYVEIAKLPISERLAKVKEWDQTRNTKNPVMRLIMPALEKCHNAECRDQTLLRAAAVAVACERYRLKDKDKNWPASLDVLVKEKLLGAVLADPFDDQPLRYRRTKDGIVVYSIGFDLKDDGGAIDRNLADTNVGMDIGFRLWNVDRRRQAAPPVVVIRE